jgi:hypothetical protein
MRLPIRRADPTAVAATQEAWAAMVTQVDAQMIAHGAATSVLEAKVSTGWRRYRWRVGYPIGEIMPGQMETTAHEGRAFTAWGAKYARSRYDATRDRRRYLGPAMLASMFGVGAATASLLGMFVGYRAPLIVAPVCIVASLAVSWLGEQIVRDRTDATCVHPDHPGYHDG